jgi:hypothetical protein
MLGRVGLGRGKLRSGGGRRLYGSPAHVAEARS